MDAESLILEQLSNWSNRRQRTLRPLYPLKSPEIFYRETPRSFMTQGEGHMPAPRTGSVIFSGSGLHMTKKHKPISVQQAHVSIATRIKPASSNLTCNFCRGNGERPAVYNSHALRDGDRNLTCPVLRSYVCPQCGGTGDTAHTLSYCPWSKEESVAKAIKQQAGRNSIGLKKK